MTLAEQFPQARDYQIKGVDDIRRQFTLGNKHVILCSPTGTGKTFMFSMLTKLVSDRKKRVLVLTDRAELLLQASGSFARFGIDPSYIIAGAKKYNTSKNVFIAMSQTLKKRIGDAYWNDFISSFDLIIIDEAHKQEFNWLFESCLVENIHVVGATATPKRSGKMRQLGVDYNVIVETISVREAVRRGFLVNCEFYNPTSVASANIAWDSKKGDYQEKSMFNAFNSGTMYKGLIKNYNEFIQNTKTMVFCCNVEHSIMTAVELQKAGFSVKYLVSHQTKPKVPKDLDDKAACERYKDRMRVYNLYTDTFDSLSGKREDVFSDFENDRVQFFVNAGIATTGYDCPSVESIIIYRLTDSVNMWLQIMGRGSRPCELIGKTHFNVMYYGDNADKLGAYDADRIWSLWHEESKGDGLPPMKLCGIDSSGKPLTSERNGCKRLIPAIYTICPHKDCGYVYPKKEVSETEMVLTVMDEDTGKLRPVKRISDMSIEEMELYRAENKHSMAWLWRKIYERGGISGIEKFAKEKRWKKSTLELVKKKCEKY